MEIATKRRLQITNDTMPAISGTLPCKGKEVVKPLVFEDLKT